MGCWVYGSEGMAMSVKLLVPPGTRFGRWTVVAEGPRHRSGKAVRRTMVVRCVCGTERTVALTHLRVGHSRSCGSKNCSQSDGGPRPRSGRGSRPVYRLWNRIKQRCYNPKNDHFRLYGARGIGMWSGWAASFECFEQDVLAEIGDWPGPGFSIDRIDNNQGYVPGNLRWATNSQQQRNKRRRG
jgi:hypothetical protein